MSSSPSFHYGNTPGNCGAARVLGFPGGSDGEESACSAGDPGSIPGSGTHPGGGNGNPFQYPCLENPMIRGAWWATVRGVAKESDTTEQLTLSLYFLKELS